MRLSNSFTSDEVRALWDAMSLLLERRDPQILVRRAAFKSVLSKIRCMRDKASPQIDDMISA